MPAPGRLIRRAAGQSPVPRCTPGRTGALWAASGSTALIPHHTVWQPGQARTAAEGGADRRSAKNADAPINQSREAHHSARPHHSPEGGQSAAVCTADWPHEGASRALIRRLAGKGYAPLARRE